MSAPISDAHGREGHGHLAVLALGANLGDSIEALRSAVELIHADPATEVVAASHLYATAPIGGPDQPDFVNAVVIVRTARDPLLLLTLAHEVEAAHDRVRAQRWGPRTLDVDVIVVDDLQRADRRLTLPHPRAHERAFVLLPWFELDPLGQIPGRGAIADLVNAPDVAVQRIRRLDAQPLAVPMGERS